MCGFPSGYKQGSGGWLRARRYLSEQRWVTSREFPSDWSRRHSLPVESGDVMRDNDTKDTYEADEQHLS